MSDTETVVTLHGIIKTERSMAGLANAIAESGYAVCNIGYPSTEKTIDQLAEYLRQGFLTDAFWQAADRVHFVTHSMGGLLIRRYLYRYRAEIPSQKIGRVVMLGTPIGGSELATLFRRIPIYKALFGPAGQELCTRACAVIDDPMPYEVGVIAGTKAWPHVFGGALLPGKNDGRVALKRTRHDGVTDHTTVHASHNELMNHPDVQSHVLHFLRRGHF